MQNIILLDTEKLAQRSFQHGDPPTPPHWRNTEGAGSPPPLPMNFSKHLTDWLGVSTVELCGRKKRDLQICVSPKVGGGSRPLSTLLPWKVGKWAPAPLVPPPVPTPVRSYVSNSTPEYELLTRYRCSEFNQPAVQRQVPEHLSPLVLLYWEETGCKVV